MIDPTLAERTCYLDGAWVVGDGAPFTSVEPGTGDELATWRLAERRRRPTPPWPRPGGASTTATGAAGRRRSGPRCCAGSRTCSSGEHEQLARLVVAEVGSPISLARTLQTADAGGQLPVGRRHGRAGPAGRLRGGAPAADRRPAVGERAAAGADRGGHRDHAVQLPDQHDQLEGRARAGRRLLRRPDAVAARGAVLGGVPPAGRGGRRAARRAQPGPGRPGRGGAALRRTRTSTW